MHDSNSGDDNDTNVLFAMLFIGPGLLFRYAGPKKNDRETPEARFDNKK
ncbi:MAG: hypothetical protein PHY34_00335 [Patescibacteria group bacterium]|nr:hypothetical protein [Patescibacteria group bacterium]MDD5715920.1 hypothetical protein [Patescibacteria group bacterium]